MFWCTSKDIKGMRERIARNVLKLLEIATKGNLKTLDTIHSRAQSKNRVISGC